MKRAIIVKGNPKIGKSSIITPIHDWIKNTYGATDVIKPANWKDGKVDEIRAILKVGKLVIGICSAGDDGATVNKFLDDCFKYDCDIIIGACRRRGSTFNSVRARLVYPSWITEWCMPEGIAPSANMALRISIGIDELKARLIALPKI
ncbi:MAG: hypothetical protein JWR05_214 [Mucilaginibacter sp.]|nr:hypothetical protein [Mucilaginibacter sp.]